MMAHMGISAQAVSWAPKATKQLLTLTEAICPDPASRETGKVSVFDGCEAQCWAATMERQVVLERKQDVAVQKSPGGQAAALQQQLPWLGRQLGPYSFETL